MTFHHLRLGLEFTVDAVKLIPNHGRVVTGDVGGGHDRIDDGEVRLGHVAQHPRRRLRGWLVREGHGRGRSSQEASSLHIGSPRERKPPSKPNARLGLTAVTADCSPARTMTIVRPLADDLTGALDTAAELF